MLEITWVHAQTRLYARYSLGIDCHEPAGHCAVCFLFWEIGWGTPGIAFPVLALRSALTVAETNIYLRICWRGLRNNLCAVYPCCRPTESQVPCSPQRSDTRPYHKHCADTKEVGSQLLFLTVMCRMLDEPVLCCALGIKLSRTVTSSISTEGRAVRSWYATCTCSSVLLVFP